jgi:hypothetical protein
MPICPQCGDQRDASAASCANCGATSVEPIGDADTPPPPRVAAELAPALPITPVGAWSESDSPPGSRRGAVAPLRRAPAAAPVQFAPRSSVALAVGGAAVSEGAISARDRERRRTPTTQAGPSEARVVPLRPQNGPPPSPAVEAGTRDPGAAAAAPHEGANAHAREGDGSEPDSELRPELLRAPEASGRTTPLTQAAARAADGARLTPSAQSAGRPPVLASEALRKDVAPATPAGTEVRKLTAALGLAGMAGALALCGPTGVGLPLGGAFLALVVLALVPMPYQARASGLVTVAGSGLAVVTWSRVQTATDLERLVLLVGVLLLSMALLFRAWHRASLLARALVALGATVCAGWLAMSGALHKLLILEAEWQQWLPAVLPLVLAIVLLLSLLAFMDSRSTGGCGAWTALLLGWYTLYSWLELIPIYWSEHGTALHGAAAIDGVVTVLSGPLFTVVLAAGLAQLLSVATAEND